MRGRRFLNGILAAALLATPALAQETPPEGGTPKDFSLPVKQTINLDNGLGVTFVPYGALPQATVRLVVRVGNLNEAADEVWLADLTGDLMEQGTTSRSAEQIAREAAAMGGELSIGVGPDQSTVGGDVLADFADEFVTLVADVVRNPAFPESELSRLKADRIRQLNVAKQRPQQLTLERFRAVMYGDHPYGRVFPTDEMLQGYTVGQVRDFYAANFGALRSHLYVVGRFDQAAVETAVREAFGGWAAGAEPLINVPSPQSDRDIYIVDRPDAVQSSMLIGLPVVGPADEDYVPLQVTNSLLGGSFGSRITSNIREDKGYTYSPFSRISNRYRDSYWVESADVTTDVTGPSLKEIFYEIDRLRRDPPPPEEVQGIQNYRAGIFVLQNASRTGIARFLAFLRLHGLDDSYLTNYVRNVYAVTPEGVRRMAETYLRPDKMLIVITGDQAKISDQVAPYGRLVN